MARALKQLRNGHDVDLATHLDESNRWTRRDRGRRHLYMVESFFEIFYLQLQLDFRRSTIKAKAPSCVPNHIIFNLRNHFENLVDLRNVDDRRTPIIRESVAEPRTARRPSTDGKWQGENIDMLGLAGRECAIYSTTDVRPKAFLNMIMVAGWIMASYSLLRRCDRFVDWSPVPATSLHLPTLGVMGSMATLSLLSATMTTVLAEIRRMWDPFGKGVNMDSWTLGIATEIINILNDFFEYDPDAVVRTHSYMDPADSKDDEGFDGESTKDRAQTV